MESFAVPLAPRHHNGADATDVLAAPRVTQERPTPLRVAALIDTVQVSGPGRQLAAVARRLASLGVDARVVTFHRAGRPRSPYLDLLDDAGVQYTVIGERGAFDVRVISRVRHILAEWSPAIVQTHGYKPAAVAYALRRLRARWSWIAFFHGATSENRKTRFYHWLDARLMAHADRVVTMSRRQQSGLSRLGAKVTVLYNAAMSTASATELPRVFANALHRPHGVPVIGVVGRLSPEKGVDLFLHSCHELHRRGVTFVAIIAGDGPERVRLETLRGALGLGDRVRFLGPVAAVDALYPHLDLLVIPSRSEGLPNVLLEALCADVPVVATDVGAIADVIDSPLAGTVVPPESPRALADAIENALSLEHSSAASAARRAIAERFSLERRARAHLDLYADVLQRPGLRGDRHTLPREEHVS